MVYILQRHERGTALQTLREELLKSLQTFVQMAADVPLPDRCAVDASSLLRLYCALKVFKQINQLKIVFIYLCGNFRVSPE